VKDSHELLGLDHWKEVGQGAKALCKRREREIERAVRQYNHSLKQVCQLYETALAARRQRPPKGDSGVFLHNPAAEQARATRKALYFGSLEKVKAKLELAEKVVEDYPGLLDRRIIDLRDEIANLRQAVKHRLAGRWPPYPERSLLETIRLNVE